MRIIYSGNNKGISLIEVLVAAAIIVIILASLFNLTLFSLKLAVTTKEVQQADFLAREMIEAVRTFRNGTDWYDNGLASLGPGIAYYPLKDETSLPVTWLLIEGQEQINQFSRQVIFEDVYRDNNDHIVQNGGSKDEDTKKVTAFVFWGDNQIEITTYLTNWR